MPIVREIIDRLSLEERTTCEAARKDAINAEDVATYSTKYDELAAG